MEQVISSFGFNGAEGKESLTHATICDEQLIDESIPMSHEHFQLIQKAIKRAHNIGVEKMTKVVESKLKFDKPYI